MGRRRVRQGRGGVSTTSNSPPSNGSTGSTTVACSANSAMSRQQSLNTSAIVNMSQPDRPGLKQTSLRETRGGSDSRRALLRIIRRYLRKLLIWLPGGTVILPTVRWIYRRLPFLDWRRKRYAASEARRIRSAISANCRRFIIVINFEVFGPNYGEFIIMLAIARYVVAKKCSVVIRLVNTKALYPDVTREEFDNYINEITDIATASLDSEFGSIRLVPSFAEATTKLSDECILFEDFTIDGRFIVGDCFNVLNNLMADTSEPLRDRILFSSNDFAAYTPKAFGISPYVSWHCRYSLLNHSAHRQTTPDEFLKSHTYLRNRFPTHRILIVSDARGCRHYASLARDLGIDDVLFSKDYSSNFLGDAALVMNSDFFYWLRAGGMNSLPLVSRMPYEMLGPLGHETMWDKRRLTSWQEETQSFVVPGGVVRTPT